MVPETNMEIRRRRWHFKSRRKATRSSGLSILIIARMKPPLPNSLLEPEHWYHMAAASDGRELRLYVNALDGRGYRLLASDTLPNDGQTALGTGGPEAVWTLGRGKSHNGKPGQWFKGWIDEVRISDIALEPSSFLFAEKNPGNNSPQEVQASFDAAQATAADGIEH